MVWIFHLYCLSLFFFPSNIQSILTHISKYFQVCPTFSSSTPGTWVQSTIISHLSNSFLTSVLDSTFCPLHHRPIRSQFPHRKSSRCFLLHNLLQTSSSLFLLWSHSSYCTYCLSFAIPPPWELFVWQVLCVIPGCSLMLPAQGNLKSEMTLLHPCHPLSHHVWCSLWFSSVQLLSCVWLFVTPWTAARQASPSITNSQSLLKLTSVESVMPPNNLIFCHPLLLLPSIFPQSGSFPMSQFFTWGGQSIWVSASASVLPINIQQWFPWGLTGLIL